MKFRQTMRYGLAAILAAGAFAVMAPSAQAQGGGGAGGGGFQMPPEMKAKIEAWRKWSENHKNLTNVGDLLYQVNELNKDAAAHMDKKQSTGMLKIVDTWKSKTTMSEDEAKSLSKQITGMLSDKQLRKLATIEAPSARMRRGFGGGGGAGGAGGGGPRPGGAGAGGGGPRPGGGGAGGAGGFKMPDPPAKGWNPFNPDTMPFEQARPRMKTQMKELVGNLTKYSKG